MDSRTVKMQSCSSSVLKALDCNYTSPSPRPTTLNSPSSPDQSSFLPPKERKSTGPYCSDAQDSDPCQAGHERGSDEVVSGKGTDHSLAVEIPLPSSNMDLLAELTDSDFLFDGPEMPLNPQNTPEARGGKVSPLYPNKSRDKGYQSSPLAEPTALAWLTDIFENYDDSIIQDAAGSLSSEPLKPTFRSSTELVASDLPGNNHPNPAAQFFQDTHQSCRKLSGHCHAPPPLSPSKPKSTHTQFKDQPEPGRELEHTVAGKLKKPSNKTKLSRRRYLSRTLRRTSLKNLRTSLDNTPKDPDLRAYPTIGLPPSLSFAPCQANVPVVWYGRLWSATRNSPGNTRATGGLADGMAISENLKKIGRSYLPFLEELEQGPLFGWNFYRCRMWISLSHEEDAADHRAQNVCTHKYQVSLNIPVLLLYVFVLVITANLYIISLSIFSGALACAHRLQSRVADIFLQELETLQTVTSTHRLPQSVTECLSYLQRNPRVDLGFELERVH